MNNSKTPRRKRPVFVLGSPRSGTTLLYDMLLSAGGFAVYLAEANVFNFLVPRSGDLGVRRNREALVDAWLNSKLFKASGLEAPSIRLRIVEECRNGGDFLKIVMEEICRRQGVDRWAENSPEGMLYLPDIKRLIPDALIIHIIRDGRDVAASLAQLRYVGAFPWEDRLGLAGCGLYWEWLVQHGHRFGATLGVDYMETNFESLISQPQKILDQIGKFIDQDLDYEMIRRVAYGSVSKPNTSFRTQSPTSGFNPVGRWKNAFSRDELVHFERLVGNTLQELGYALATDAGHQPDRASLRFTRTLHRAFFSAKRWYKNDPMIRVLRPRLTAAEIDESVLADDHPPRLRIPASTP